VQVADFSSNHQTLCFECDAISSGSLETAAGEYNQK